MKEYENYNFDKYSEDSKFVKFWKEISRYNWLFFVFFIFSLYLIFKDSPFYGFFEIAFIIFIIFIFFPGIFIKIIKGIKKEPKKDKGMILSEIPQTKNKIEKSNKFAQIFSLVFLILVAISYINPKIITTPFDWIDDSEIGSSLFLFFVVYLIVYGSVVEREQKKKTGKKVLFFSWKRAVVSLILAFGFKYFFYVIYILFVAAGISRGPFF